MSHRVWRAGMLAAAVTVMLPSARARARNARPARGVPWESGLAATAGRYVGVCYYRLRYLGVRRY